MAFYHIFQNGIKIGIATDDSQAAQVGSMTQMAGMGDGYAETIYKYNRFVASREGQALERRLSRLLFTLLYYITMAAIWLFFAALWSTPLFLRTLFKEPVLADYRRKALLSLVLFAALTGVAYYFNMHPFSEISAIVVCYNLLALVFSIAQGIISHHFARFSGSGRSWLSLLQVLLGTDRCFKRTGLLQDLLLLGACSICSLILVTGSYSFFDQLACSIIVSGVALFPFYIVTWVLTEQFTSNN